PHGAMVAAAVRGRMPFYIRGAAAEVVGVEDAARALVLAGERGRIGERYIVSERFMTAREIYEVACAAVDVEPPKRGVPIAGMAAASYVAELIALLRRRTNRLRPLCVRLMHIMSPADHRKAVRELEWRPRPAPEAIADAARFFLANQVATKGR